MKHGWRMPEGLTDSRKRDLQNFTLSDWQQAKRTGRDARQITAAIQDAWAISDSRAGFEHALEERGFKLAQGKRSRFVAVDALGGVYAVARKTGIKAKLVKDRLGNAENLPSAETAIRALREQAEQTLKEIQDALIAKKERFSARFESQRKALVSNQRHDRRTLNEKQEARRLHETKTRQARFRKGLSGLWDRLRGEHKRIQTLNAQEALKSQKRDRSEQDQLIQKQLSARRRLSLFKMRYSEAYQDMTRQINRERDMLMNERAGSTKSIKLRGPKIK